MSQNHFAKKVVFGQYWNFEAVKTFGRALLIDRRYFIPQLKV
jgi:phosphatidylglycerophosphatase GEP4